VSPRRLLPSWPTRLVAKLWIIGRKRRGSERANENLWAGHQKVAPYYVQSSSDRDLRLGREKEEEAEEKKQAEAEVTV
jgi:hypothetical protein